MTQGNRLDGAGVNTTNNTAGTTVERNSSNKGFSPFPADSVAAQTANATLDAGSCGLNTVSGSAGAITLVLPLAANVPGAKFVFRTTSADAHILTGSQEVAGTKVFAVLGAATLGSKLTMPAVVGSSVVVESDGLHYIVNALSGVVTVNGT
jgi:hypothetical protein